MFCWCHWFQWLEENMQKNVYSFLNDWGLRRREKDLLLIRAVLKWQKSSFTNLQAVVIYLNMKVFPSVYFDWIVLDVVSMEGWTSVSIVSKVIFETNSDFIQSVFRKYYYVTNSLSHSHGLHCHSFVPNRELSQYHMNLLIPPRPIFQVPVEENFT